MKTLKYSLVALATVCLTACDNYLEKLPLDSVTDATFFKTESDIKQFTDGFYKSMVPDYTTTTIFDFRSDLVGQNMARSGNAGYSEIQFGTMTSASKITEYYWDYAPIRNAYILLGKIDDVEMTEDARKLYLGTTNYLLAYRYFMMFRAYENVPIVREVLEVENSDIPASPKEEVFNEALTQINKAIENLPSLGPTERERGRLTKLVALTLKADLLLYTACRYQGTMTGATFKDAADATSAALKEADERGYGLAENYMHLFYSKYQADSDPQREIILEYVRLKDIATDSFCHGFGPRYEDAGYGSYSSSQEFIDMYLCTDGKPINKSPLYDPSHPFKNRDPRLKLTTLYPGNVCSFEDGRTWVSNTLDPDENNYDYMLSTYNQIDRSPSGYINIKYWDHQRKSDPSYASFIVYRYGELLLMYAEAMNEAYGPSAEVYNALSKLRGRTGIDMPPVTKEDYPTKESVRSFIRNERAVELFGEGKRYWDIIRWGAGEELMNKSFYSMHISKFNKDGSFAGYMDKIYVRTDVDDETKEELFEIPDGAKGGILMHTGIFNDKKFYVWPIPQSAINKSFSGALKQHPLWE